MIDLKKICLSLGILFLMLNAMPSFAQVRNCGSTQYLLYQMMNDAKRADKLEKVERHYEKVMENNFRAVNGVITIPVVVHVVYNTSSENISDAQIQSQIQVLNEDFRRLNSDADGTWSQAADTEIEFCLASVDPSGNPSTGITRTSTSTSAFGTNDQVKFNSSGGKDAWPSGSYMNMWVCDISGGILGYAQFPGGSPSTDGVVVDYQYFGTIGTASAPFDLGRTATHEVGHWLNLRHIWGDGGCSVDDGVSDTPTSDAPNYGCPTGHVSCSSTDMVQNYMDYTDDACMNLYTAGQTSRMRALFEPGGARASLLNSTACGGTPPTPTCDDGIQNGDETDVDCGGSCPPCAPCTDNLVTISITLDNYPEETSWAITNASGATVASGGTYASSPDGSTVSEELCLVDGCYTFTINDTYGDGICCSYGSGSYTVSSSGGVLASGGSFASSEATDFCFGGTAPTCTDGVQNGSETGVDCGGPDCVPCATCSDGVQNGSETGVDCGGPDCAPCTSCSDGVQNGSETGVDCGGPDCAPCTSCSDGVQNGSETGVDCGGPDCAPCTSCSDGVQNGSETGVDCGGPDCAPCTSCTDGVQNGSETGVDCGGPDCEPCSTGGCTYTTIDSEGFESGFGIWIDGGSDCSRSTSFPNSGSYSLRLRDNSSSSVVTTGNLSLNGYTELKVNFSYYATSMDNSNEDFWLQISLDGGSSYTTVEEWNQGDEFNNNERKYDEVTITGTFNNQTRVRFRCDASGNSDWVYLDDITISACSDGGPVPTCTDGIQNGSETGVDCGGPDCDPCVSCTDGIQNGSETGVDCGGPDCDPCATCSDGIQNGSETGVDCGGPDCDPCDTGGPCSYVTIDSHDFEGSWGIWNDGGSDCAATANFPNSGVYSIYIRDNSSSSVLTTDILNLASYDELTVDFSYYPYSMDNSNEDFWLQVSTNGGSTFTTVEEWNQGDEFENNQRKFDAVVIPGPFTSNTLIRFRCDASANNDYVFLDDITISGCLNSARGNETELNAGQSNFHIMDMKLYPNPATDQITLNLQVNKADQFNLAIMDISGKFVESRVLNLKEGYENIRFDTNDFAPGMYLLHISNADGMMSRKFIIQR